VGRPTSSGGTHWQDVEMSERMEKELENYERFEVHHIISKRYTNVGIY